MFMDPVISIVIAIVVIILSMTIHEAVHAFVGYILGDKTAMAEGRLTLNPFKHIDPVMTVLLPILMIIFGGPVFGGAKPVPFNPSRLRYGEWGAVMVALVGPLTNLLIAFLAFGVGVVSGVITSGGYIDNSLPGSIIQLTIFINVGFFVFNMLPIPPLDGSRLLYALAPDGVRRIMSQIEQYGVFVIFAIVVLLSGFISRLMLVCVESILYVFLMIFHV